MLFQSGMPFLFCSACCRSHFSASPFAGWTCAYCTVAVISILRRVQQPLTCFSSLVLTNFSMSSTFLWFTYTSFSPNLLNPREYSSQNSEGALLCGSLASAFFPLSKHPARDSNVILAFQQCLLSPLLALLNIFSPSPAWEVWWAGWLSPLEEEEKVKRLCSPKNILLLLFL